MVGGGAQVVREEEGRGGEREGRSVAWRRVRGVEGKDSKPL